MSIASSMAGLAVGGKKNGIAERNFKPPMEAEGREKSPVHEHLAAMHAKMGGKHMHVHSDGMGPLTSHHIGEDGKMEGPHDHENMEALKDHMSQFFNEEEHEGAASGGGHESLMG